MRGPTVLMEAATALYHKRGVGSFDGVAVKAGITKADGFYSLSVSTFDYDNDGWPDIYVACDSRPSILYHNNHDGTFTDVAGGAGGAFNQNRPVPGVNGFTAGGHDRRGRRGNVHMQ